MSKLEPPVPPASKAPLSPRAKRARRSADSDPFPSRYSPATARLVPKAPVPDCHVLAAEVHEIIRSFHSSVASPLATIGLELELLRLDPETSNTVSTELVRINGSLDEVITVIREANRKLREVEKQITSHSQPTQG